MTKKLLMGNEAFAHAALEAGVSVVAGYPGTPSSELVETVSRMRANGRAQGVHVEWSTNEKAALELCAGASMSGARALFTCKQVGLNVASDALMSLNYVGVRGGLVLFVADDPGPISSQTEQDTRRFAMFAKLPVFDPATPEQGYLMMKAAFELSEEYNTPVIVRPTTRINHASTFFDVEDATKARPLPTGGFRHDADRWVIFPKRSYEAHGQILDRLNSMTRVFSLDPHYTRFFPVFEHGTDAEPLTLSERRESAKATAASAVTNAEPDGGAAKAESETTQPATEQKRSGEAPYLGIMCGGVSTQYAREALEMLDRLANRAGEKLPPYRFMQMGIAYPFTNRAARRFMDGLSHILVLEELDSVLEEELIVAASGGFLSAHVHGKLTGEAPTRGENSTESLAYAIAHFFDTYEKAPITAPAALPAGASKAAADTTAKSGAATDAKAADAAGASGEARDPRAAAKDKDRRGTHRAPDHVREEAPEPEPAPRLGLIGVAAEVHAQRQAEEAAAAAAMPARMNQRQTSRRQTQGAARRRHAHAARYRSPASKIITGKLPVINADGTIGDQKAAAANAQPTPARRTSFLSLVEQQLGPSALLTYQGSLPPRPPVLCAGCPHRGSFYAIKSALDKMGVRRSDAILCGDIGCYTLGNALPLAAVDTCLCMGAGITMAQGFNVVEPGKKQVAFVGDSTFFASGMTGVVNAVYNGHDVTFAILDNATTAMTGSQPHPGTGVTLMGDRRPPVRIDAMLEAMGVEVILYADPLDRAQSEEVALMALRHKGPSAIIFQSPCVWMKPFGIPAEVDTEVCTGCKRCITDIGCPAITFNPDARGRKSGLRGQAMIDTDLCNGCGLCTQICPFDAISVPSMLDYAARDQAAVRVGTGMARPLSGTTAHTSATQLAAAAVREDDDRPGIEDIGDTHLPVEDELEPDMADDPEAFEDEAFEGGTSDFEDDVDEKSSAKATRNRGPRHAKAEPEGNAESGALRTKEVGSVELDLGSLFGGALTLQIDTPDSAGSEDDDG